MQTEISRAKRHIPPAHYSLKFHTYSLLSETVEKYESGVFEAGGYKWRLFFYPNGDKKKNVEDYISLYLGIVETDEFPLGWEVYVNFKLFVLDQLEDKYLTIQFQDEQGGVKRFHEMKTAWGFRQFLEHETFVDPSNGYLADDTFVLGAEVFVINYSSANWESISLVKSPNITNPIFTWEIENFSKCDKESYDSEVFTIGGKNWYLMIYPNGQASQKGKALALYLMPSNNSGGDQNKAAVCAKYKLRLLDQVNGGHSEDSDGQYCFKASHDTGFGFSNFISLKELRKPSNGFLMKDSLKVQVEFVALSITNYSSENLH